MTPSELEEYRALRATIRERGTARLWVVLVGFVAWAALAIVVNASSELPIATLLPLLILGLTFEIVFSLHFGVERIGRYLQVFVEEARTSPGWETHVMAYGRRYGGVGCDALFSPFFAAAAIGNFVPVVLAGPVLLEWVFVGALHAAFIGRIAVARHQAAQQRGVDLERFQQLRSGN